MRSFLAFASASPIERIDFHLEAVRVKPPINHTATTLVPTFCSLYGTFGAPCAPDHNALLEALVCMTINAEQTFERRSLDIGTWGITTYDPTAASGSAEAAWFD